PADHRAPVRPRLISPPGTPTTRHSRAGALLSGIGSCEQAPLYPGEFSLLASSSIIDGGIDLRPLEQGGPNGAEELPQRAGAARCPAVQGQQQIGNEGTQDLDADRVLTAPQVLLDL